MIELKNINVDFSGKVVLNDVSVTFQGGEIIGLVAPNGTGKSTLINVVMNYLRPHGGKVVFNDQLEYSSKINEVKIHQIVSMMPDQSDLYNHLTGKEHLEIFSSMWNSDPSLIESTIKDLNMESYIKKKTGTYSLGMRQRLCFAMQIVTDTQMMMMDEVMNGLDPTQVEIISQLLLRKKMEGKTLVIASHLLENLEKYADRIFFLKNGLLSQIDELYPGYGENTTVRVTGITEEIKETFSTTFPDLQIQLLSNGMSLIDFPENHPETLTEIASFLKSYGITEFSLGKVTLNDLYSKYYHGKE